MRKILFLIAATAAAQNWPSFRGPEASGVADGQHLPVKWDAARGKGILWSTAVPGLAHSSPIIWGDRIFVTTAVSSKPDATFKRGLYGDGDASDDLSAQRWKLLSFHRDSGKLLWEQTAYEGTPKEKRHMKATYANSTPAIHPGKDRTELVTNGSNFVRGYDPMTGKELWRVGGSSKITAPTPVYSGDLVIVASGRRPEAPIFAIRGGTVAWQKQQRGPY